MSALLPELNAATIKVLDELFALARKLTAHAPDSSEVDSAVAALARTFARAKPPFALQVFADVILRDRMPLELTLESLRRCQQLVSACARFGVQELAIDEVPPPASLIGLASALLLANNSGRGTRLPRLAGVRFNRLARPAHGAQLDEALLDRLLAEQLACAVVEAEQLGPSDNTSPWPWSQGRALVWRLERCLLTSVTATGRALELAPGAWTPARRSVSAAFRAGAVLSRLRVSPLSQRAAMHALLLLGAFGYAERSGITAHEAARFARPRWLASAADGAIDAHQLRVCALLDALSQGSQAAEALPLTGLLSASYELERRRCPSDTDFNLSRLELQAWLAGALGSAVHADFGRALLAVLGLVSIGSYVLADGRLGVVAAPNEHGDPARPRVLVGGQLVAPIEPVVLCSPFGGASESAHRA